MLKNNLRKEEVLPDGLSWEDTKDGIYSRMDAHAAKENRNRRRVLFFLLFGIFISIISFVGYHFTRDSKIDESAKDQSVESTIAKVEDTHIEKTKLNSSSKKDRHLQALSTPKEIDESKTSFTKKNNRESNNSIISTNETLGSGLAWTNSSNDSNILESHDAHQALLKEQKGAALEYTNTQIAGVTVQDEKIKQLDKLKFENLDLQQLKLVNTPLLEVNTKPLIINPSLFISNQEDKHKDLRSTYITFGGGLNYALSDFGLPKSASYTALEENAELGYSGSIRLSKDIKHFYISSGIHWQKMFRKAAGVFDNTYKVDREVLVEVNTNPFTGSRDIFQDTLLNQSDLIRFAIHSNIESVSLPLVFGVQKKFSKLYCHIGTGVNLSFVNTYSSKEIVRLNDQSDYEFTNISGASKFSFDVMGEFGLGLNIGTKLRLGSRISYTLKLRDFTLSDNTVSRPKVLNGEIVLGYRF